MKYNPKVAEKMTCPNTLGLFNPRIREMAERAHAHDALLYYDGANLNALLGRCRPGDLGFDVVHVNLHKMFATPHGGGGPGAGPVGVQERLVPYLPTSVIVKRNDGTLALEYERPKSIASFAPQPETTPVSRVDELKAARDMRFTA
jgi:glycine dehydrogenase subunit 2